MVVVDVADAGALANHLATAHKQGKLVMVDFFATWCGPCKAIAPTVESLSNKFAKEATFLKLDVDRVPDAAKAAGVTAMPSFGFYGDNKLVELMKGADPRGLEERLVKYIAIYHKNPFKNPGYSLTSSTPAPTSSSSSSSTSSSSSSAVPRKNPWADPNFVPGGAKKAVSGSSPSPPPSSSSPQPRTNLPVKESPSPSPSPSASPSPVPHSSSPLPSASPSDETSIGLVHIHSAALKVDDSLLTQLMSMGFNQIRSEKALIMTQNKDVDVALEWLMAHQEDADIDEILTVVRTQTAPSKSAIDLESLSEDERLIYEEMQKRRVKETSQSSAIASSAAASSSPSSAQSGQKSVSDMTSEEKMAWLAARKEEVKLKREKEAFDKVKSDFKSSKGMTSALNNLKEQREEEERQAAILKRKKEDADKAKQRKEIAERLAADKERRRLEQQRQNEAVRKAKEAKESQGK